MLLLGFGTAIVHADALPQWLGWVGILIAVALAIPPALFIALIALLLWLAVVSVWLFVVVRKSSPAPQPATT